MLPELAEPGTDPRLDRPERLLKMRSRFGIRHVRKERSLDRLALVVREDGDCLAQPQCQLLAIERLAVARRVELREQLLRIRVDAFLAPLVAQAIDRPRPRLVQDPPEDRAVRGV